jgi:hypothetical protein
MTNSLSSLSTTIYVGNIQSIPDEQLREYFQRFAPIEDLYHNCSCPADEWLIDFRFIRFTSNTDISIFINNQVDHTICRTHLDIHTYEAACRSDTRLAADRKICIAHTDTKLNRNVVKKVDEIIMCSSLVFDLLVVLFPCRHLPSMDEY